MIKPEFTCFQVQMKSWLRHTTESTKSGFGITPAAFNSIDMRLSIDEFIGSMLNPKVIFISQVNESIITSPSISVDDTFRIYASPDNLLQSGSPAIWDDFSVDLSVSFEDTQNDCFSRGSSASSTLIMRRAPK